MEEKHDQEDSKKKIQSPPIPAIREKVTERNETETSSSNSGDTKIKEWLKRYNEPSPHLIINILLMIATFLLFWKAANQSGSAEKAANAAREAAQAAKDGVNQYKRANDIADSNLKLAKMAFDSTTKDNRDRFKLESTNTEKQIEALKNTIEESRNQFKIQNEPFLQIINPEIVEGSFGVGKVLEIRYYLINLRIAPIKILGIREAAAFDIGEEIINKSEYQAIYTGVNLYIIKETPLERHWTGEPLTEIQFKNLENGPLYLYRKQIIEYENTTTKERRIYKFEIKMKPLIYRNNSLYYEFIYNDNKDTVYTKMSPTNKK